MSSTHRNRQTGDSADHVVQVPSNSCRILYIIGELHTGGSERQLWYLLRAMDRDRYKPVVVVWNFCETDLHVAMIRSLGVPLLGFSQTETRVRKLRRLRALIKCLKPEVVHSWSFYTNFAAYLSAKGTTAVCVGSIRSDFSWAVKQCGPIAGKLNARWPRRQVCNSAAAAESVDRAGGYFSAERVWIVRNGIDLDEFAALSVSDCKPIRFVGIGYLLPVKRWDILLVAVERLKNLSIDFIAQIAGDGPLRASLQKLAEDLGVLGHVQFLGHVDNIPKLISEAAFLVHTGDAEGCPNAVMEAMASGRAVIATNAGDISNIVEDGRTGFVVQRGDIEALSGNIRRLLSDLHLCQKMGEAARRKAENIFGMNNLVRETFEIYRRLGWQKMHSLC